jgi:hypothetical protein
MNEEMPGTRQGGLLRKFYAQIPSNDGLVYNNNNNHNNNNNYYYYYYNNNIMCHLDVSYVVTKTLNIALILSFVFW